MIRQAMKMLAEGFGKEEDLVMQEEINLRVWMNCWITESIFAAIILLC